MTQRYSNCFKLWVLLHIVYSYIQMLCVCYFDPILHVCSYVHTYVKLNCSFLSWMLNLLNNCVDVLWRWWSCSNVAWYKIHFNQNNTSLNPKRYNVGAMLHIPMIIRRIKDSKYEAWRHEELLFHMSVFLLYVRRCLRNVCIRFKRVMHLPIIFHSTWLAIFA